MVKAKYIIGLCLLLSMLFGYQLGSSDKAQLDTQASSKPTQIALEYQTIKTSGIDEVKQKNLEEFIANFYQDKRQGKHTTTGYYIREMAPLDGHIMVFIDELRTTYSGGEYVGYLANISNLTFEIEENDDDFKIIRYYHTGVKDASPNEGYSDY